MGQKKSNPLHIEDKIRKRLSKRFGVELKNRKLADTFKHHFDMVSSDEKIVGEIKTNGPDKNTGKMRSAHEGAFAQDCLKLLGCKKAKKRYFILTNRRLYEAFKESQTGKCAARLGIIILNERVN